MNVINNPLLPHSSDKSIPFIRGCLIWFKHILFHNFTIIHSNIYNVCSFKGSEQKLKTYRILILMSDLILIM